MLFALMVFGNSPFYFISKINENYLFTADTFVEILFSVTLIEPVFKANEHEKLKAFSAALANYVG